MTCDEIVERIRRNAHVLGKLARKVEKLESKPHLMTEWDERDVLRYQEIHREQEQLLGQLRSLKSIDPRATL